MGTYAECVTERRRLMSGGLRLQARIIRNPETDVGAEPFVLLVKDGRVERSNEGMRYAAIQLVGDVSPNDRKSAGRRSILGTSQVPTMAQRQAGGRPGTWLGFDPDPAGSAVYWGSAAAAAWSGFELKTGGGPTLWT